MSATKPPKPPPPSRTDPAATSYDYARRSFYRVSSWGSSMRQSQQTEESEDCEESTALGIHASGVEGARRLPPTHGAATTSCTTTPKEAPSSLGSPPGELSLVTVTNDKPSPGEGETQVNSSSGNLPPPTAHLSDNDTQPTRFPTATNTIPLTTVMTRSEVVVLSDATTESVSEETGDPSSVENIPEAETDSSAGNPAPEANMGLLAGETSDYEAIQGSETESTECASKEARPERNPSPPLKKKPTPKVIEIDDDSDEEPEIIVIDDDTVEESAVESHKESVQEPRHADTLPELPEEGTPLGESVTVSRVEARVPARATSLTAFLGDQLRKRIRPEEKSIPMAAPRVAIRVPARVPSLTAFLGKRFRKRKNPEEVDERPSKRPTGGATDRKVEDTRPGVSLDTETIARRELKSATDMAAKASSGSPLPATTPDTTVGPPLADNSTSHESHVPDPQSHGRRKIWRRPTLGAKRLDSYGRCTQNCRTNERNVGSSAPDKNRILPRTTTTDLTQWSVGEPFCVDVFTDDSMKKPMALSLDIPAEAVTLRDVREALEPVVRAALNPSPKWEFLLPGGAYLKLELEDMLFLAQFLEETDRGKRFSIRTVEEHTPAIIRVKHEWGSKGRRKALLK